MRQSDSINAFINEMLVFGQSFVTTRAENYQNYKDYCEVFGLKDESDRRFVSVLHRTKGVSECKSSNQRAWKGVRCKKIDDDGNIKDFQSTDSTLSTHCTP